MVRRGMPALDIWVSIVRLMLCVDAPSIPASAKALVRMLWARMRPMCSSGSSLDGKSQGVGASISSKNLSL